jgi:demethylmenaquinone methyltransferase/2-methoxy-6-polyprenyl-1,4-benzoquinol methylase
VANQWVDCDQSFIAQRYDRIAGLIGFIDWLFFVPGDLRKKAPIHLGLKPGDRVLEVGCGTGLNFPYLHDAIGPGGRIHGVDISAGMLAKARELCERHRWSNVDLIQCDAADYVAPEPLDGVLFGISYNTMPHHLQVLRHCWEQLKPGGRLVIIDGKLPPGLGGRILRRFSLWLMKRTMLGNPLIKPWEELAALSDDFQMQQILFGSWYIARATKPLPAAEGIAQPALPQLQAAE